MFDSKKYWNNRYVKGGNSGAGSYNNLAQFKGDVINNFIEKNEIKSIVDYGVGDGNQLKLINTEKLIYTGIDVSEFIISKCKEEFKDDITKRFIHADNIDNELKAELVISCDVIYHLIEEHVYKEYMEKLFSMSKKYVIIYAKNEDINRAVHVKFRKFSNYIESNLPEWTCKEHIINKVKPEASSFYIYKKVDNAIITMNLGNRDFINYTKPFMIKYSKKTNSKLIIINDSNIENIIKFFDNLTEIKIGRNNNKSYLYKVLIIIYYSRIFNKILWVDDTCFIKETCVNLYDIIADNYIMAYNEGDNKELNSWKNNETEIKRLTGFSINTNSYINAGVVLYSKDINKILNINKIIKHKELFNNSYTDQCFLNFIIQYYNIKLKLISSSYNCMFMNCSYNNNGSNIKPESIGNQFILSNKNSIFHITGFYKHRLDIVKYISMSLSEKIKIPIYISLTSIFKNQDILLQTLQSIMKQTRLPDKIFLYLSEESYILDTGFKDKKITNSNLLKLINDNSIINIKWVKNRGSYRKLLPILKEKWDEDCIIITIDDDTIYDTKLIENLINDYNKQNCVIGYRGFTPSFDKLENFDYLKAAKKQPLSSYNFFTGKGGILYKPQFFHKTRDLIFNDKIYLDTCPTGDDIWFYIVRLLNNVKGYLDNKKWLVKNLTRSGLYSNFNKHNNNNTSSFKNTFEKLKELEYKIS